MRYNRRTALKEQGENTTMLEIKNLSFAVSDEGSGKEIIKDMLEGVRQEQKSKVLTNVDRRQAIQTACCMANAGDVVLVAGKGHEDYQEIKGVKYHFDDKEVLREIFSNE